MKRMVLVLVLCLLTLGMLGCSGKKNQEPDPTVPLGEDQELIVRILQDEQLEFWNVAEAPAPGSQERFEMLCQRCVPLGQLMARDTGLESLKTYGPDLIREYLNSEDATERANALTLADVISFRIPEMKDTMDTLLRQHFMGQ